MKNQVCTVRLIRSVRFCTRPTLVAMYFGAGQHTLVAMYSGLGGLHDSFCVLWHAAMHYPLTAVHV